MNSARVPDFFMVGQPKCGTTALYEMLRQHPDIYLPDLKEPEFLASDMRRWFQPPSSGPLPSTLEQYLALFANARTDQRAGEASTFYMTSHAAASAIAALNRDARIIALFREPASFLRSLHLQLLENHVEDQRDLRRAIDFETRRRHGRRIPRRCCRPQALHYSEHVQYAAQLARYDAVFPREQMLILIYEEFRDDNAAAVRHVLRFLDVDDSAPIASTKVNATVALRSQRLDELVHRYSVGRDPLSHMVKTGIKAVVPEGTRRRLLKAVQADIVHTAVRPADEGFMEELRRRLKPEVERLSEALGRDLVTLWEYDRV
jgi:hypothetical protein